MVHSKNLSRMLCVLVAGLSMLAVSARASEDLETVDVSSSMFYLGSGQTKTVDFDQAQWRRVQKVIIQATAWDYPGTFEVLVNGDVKGTIHVPAEDPSYVVTIGEVTGSMQLRHVSGGWLKIEDVKAVQSVRYVPCEDTTALDTGLKSIPFSASNEISRLATEAMNHVDALQPFASYEEYGTYLLPIKKAAARAYATAEARGEEGMISLKAIHQLVALKKQIEFAYKYLDTAFERQAVFSEAVSLREFGERIDHLLNS